MLLECRGAAVGITDAPANGYVPCQGRRPKPATGVLEFVHRDAIESPCQLQPPPRDSRPRFGLAGERSEPMRPVLLASISGILYGLIAEPPLLPLSPPSPPYGTHDIVEYYVRYGEVLRTTQLFGGIGAIFLLVFLSGLGIYLRRLQDRPSPLTTGVVTAGVAVVNMNLIANAASLSIVLRAGRLECT